MSRAVACLLLVGCGPVHLGEEVALPSGGAGGDVGGQGGAAAMGDAATSPIGNEPDAGAPPVVVVRVTSSDCGACFDLQAEGYGGAAPYEFQWEDGSVRAQRSVCVGDVGFALSVVALDAAGGRSAPHTLLLDPVGDAGCAEPMPAIDAGSSAALCLQNASLEGDISPDPAAFAAEGWSTCTNPPGLMNAPMVGNETVAITPNVPMPTDGTTYVALGEGDQISQPLCDELSIDAPVHLQLDLARVDLGEQTEQVFLEIWGGLEVDCSQRELLWASPGLVTGWQRFCIALQPRSFMTQLTLRANADQTQLSPAYLLVDNLQPVDGCP